ncbi:copper homeostasis protein CutC [Streptomyces angustmyceticus]|uniref:Copper homeostasis protein cutC homolog n=2 Tax=Streptomyces angustmyceticus TaxID=285578 RepID=A0A5J4LLI3_9ACTN|nr:copper homeostasis protein CutC [Streptomyces angustmyceticus]UAL67644.1 copper homeostasis protein CutC [Streptomyces angustmyceticus]GES31438.1 copper homeostasis protein CutC [Streptomyces angustmyceticus]
MSKRALLEVIALGPRDAVAARAGGADRLELVTDMAADGLTPPREVFAATRAAVGLPLRVMLRAADGFAAGDVTALCEEAAALRAEGADEFVLGFLTPDGRPDLEAVAALAGAIEGCRWTFHRAIDRAADRDALRKELSGAAGTAGLDTYLTAGAAQGVAAGVPTLLAEQARTAADEPGYGPRILVGGGLALGHLPALRAAGLDAFHIGGAARPAGWSAPVDAAAVRTWREALDQPVAQPV